MLNIKEKLRKQFLADNRPWVVTFSGGKDSTLVLVLVVEMLLEFLRLGIKTKKVIVVSSDTRVEMPLAEGYLHTKLKQIEKFAKQQGLNLVVKILYPEVEDDFFVCMLGRGYPAPNMNFRWCTERLKISPATKYLTSLTYKHESIVLLLGVRSDESIARAKSIEKRKINLTDYTIHDSIPNAYCYSPIKNIRTDEVWSYLSLNDSKAPWGTNKDMMKLYDKGSSEADCNIALNPQSASCGKTRLGCWVCTVVEKDSSMEGMINNHEYNWMKPLNDFRNKINIYRYDHSTRRRKNKKGMNCAGAFYLDIRKKLLIDLFEAEKKINGHMIKVTSSGLLLSDRQIIAINEQHKKDGDFSNDTLKIANRYGRKFIIKDESTSMLSDVCTKINIDDSFFNKVFELNLQHRHSLRRLGITMNQKELVKQYVQGIVHVDK